MSGRAYTLRPWFPSEAEDYHRLLSDTRVWRFLPESMPDPFDLETAEQLLAIAADSPHHEVRAILRHEEPVGQLRLNLRSPYRSNEARARDAEISYWVAPEYWGSGIASETVALYTLLSFRKRPLRSIFARVHEDNTASLRVLERAGYRDEGDLAATRVNHQRIRTLRCFREHYLGQLPANSVASAALGNTQSARSA